eukprot:scaffold18656_cov82-Attheya_sp.AAC.3
MYVIKAFIKVQQTSKTWVVLDVVPSHLPYVVDNLKAFLSRNPAVLVVHLQTSFEQVDHTSVTVVYGTKGVYADHSFIHDSMQHIGLPYMRPAQPQLVTNKYDNQE